MQQTAKPKRTQVLLLASVVLVVLITVLATANAHAITKQLHTWKLLPEPEHLTELYFTKHSDLPTFYSAGTVQTVAFTVHNLEYRTLTYQYTIQQVGTATNTPTTLASGSFVLKQGQYARPSIPITLTGLGRSQITVTLTPTNEKIQYWMNGG